MKALKEIKYIGPKTLKALQDIDVYTPYDVLNLKPTYHMTFLDEFSQKQGKQTFLAIIISPIKMVRSKVAFSKFKVQTKDDMIEVLAFNQVYLANQYREHDEVILTGQYDFKSKKFILERIDTKTTYKPIATSYKLQTIKDHLVRKIILEILKDHDYASHLFKDQYALDYGLIPSAQVYQNLHFPKHESDFMDALTYLKHFEAYQFYQELLNQEMNVPSKKVRNYQLDVVKTAIHDLPFELSSDQKKAVNDIYRDFKEPKTVSRLLLGDVGSGKTVVAGIAAMGMKSAGYLTVLMAPTVILATQHYESIQALFKNLKVGLFTSEQDRKTILDEIKHGTYDLIIGTHVLASNDVILPNLGLVIIDEQHKFGVEIRKKLIDKSSDKDILYLTATPIPRTLFMTLFGNKALSIIYTKPKNRKPITTKMFTKSQLKPVMNGLKEAINLGQNVYMVVPSINQTDQFYGIETIANLTKKYEFTCPIMILNGEMDKMTQNDVIERFNQTKGAILISTTIIEVGIDVKHATRMVIFQSDRFGLSQLHQLRGRIGRSDLHSICYVQQKDAHDTRLEYFVNTDNGFDLSEYDLKMRGPGYYLGLNQSGIPKFKWLDYEADFQLLTLVRKQLFKDNL